MSIQGGGGMGRRARGVGAISEINVTPFVDVVLVLLVIFMITAHAMDSGIEIQVPKTDTAARATKDLAIVSLTKDGDTYLGKDPVNIHDMAAKIHAKYPGQDAVYLRADRETTFDVVAQVMSALGEAKFSVSVVTQPDGGGRK